MELSGKRFAVIGGAGLIGSHTVDALLKEDVGEVVVYDNFVRGTLGNLANAMQDPRLRINEAGGDICQTDILGEALHGIDGVFHFAALWLLHCQDYPRSAFEVNVQGTFNVLEACVAAGVQRLVYSSSASVYGDAVQEPMTEDHPMNNTTFYGATKIAGEAMARAMYHRYGLPFVNLRYMNVYGPRQDYKGAYLQVVMRMLDSIDRGEPLTVYGDGSQAYDFVHVEDCGRANICAMRSAVTDKSFNVGTGYKTSILELAHLLIELTGSDSPIHLEPQGQTFVKNRVGSPAAVARDLRFEAAVDLADGMRSLIEWRREDKVTPDTVRLRACVESVSLVAQLKGAG